MSSFGAMTTRRLFTIMFGISIFVLAVRQTVDPDLWWHLKTGETIMKQGILRSDVFSFTIPGHPWITHEWLSEVFMWKIYQAGGLSLLIILFAFLTASAFWLVYWTSAGRPYLAAMVVILALICSAVTFGQRPQIFTLFFLTIYVNVVERFRDRKIGPKALLLLPLLTVLWANMHSGYVVGVVLLGTYTIGAVLDLSFQNRDPHCLTQRQTVWLAGVTAFCMASALLNPNGYYLWIYPMLTLGSSFMQTVLQEWLPPNFHEPRFWAFGVMMILGVGAGFRSRRKPVLTDVLLFLGTAAAGLCSARHIPIFAVVAAPIISRILIGNFEGFKIHPWLTGEFLDRKPSKFISALHGTILAAFVLLAASRTHLYLEGNSQMVKKRFPVAACDFLEKNGLGHRRGYHEYHWGGYLIFRGFPVFVDGRADVYGDSFLSRYLAVYRLKEDWNQILEEFQIDYILMARDYPLKAVLATTRQWQQAYEDDIAQIFIRQPWT
ncbi:MAG: hypothetical protein NC930_07565 [Candidatus Omnitrophica bacterium]|nr:hypothetical protein [Candidatus Omnitrophota bacterium]